MEIWLGMNNSRGRNEFPFRGHRCGGEAQGYGKKLDGAARPNCSSVASSAGEFWNISPECGTALVECNQEVAVRAAMFSPEQRFFGRRHGDGFDGVARQLRRFIERGSGRNNDAVGMVVLSECLKMFVQEVSRLLSPREPITGQLNDTFARENSERQVGRPVICGDNPTGCCLTHARDTGRVRPGAHRPQLSAS